MIKTKSIALLFVSMILISVMAISLIFYVEEDVPRLSETVTVSSDGVAEETLTVQSLTINPGETRECYVFLRSELEGDFSVKVTFDEICDNGLKPFVDVIVYIDDEAVYDGTLTNLLANTAVSFLENLDSETPSILKIQYKMPVETGNDAQGTTASFYIKIKIEKE
ncbi:MAG: hypothetical protein IKA54_00335 [Clostridia bacterium]|nr:hypothetical protein [Clostridia bacterium]